MKMNLSLVLFRLFIKKTEINPLSVITPPTFPDNPYSLMDFEADQHK